MLINFTPESSSYTTENICHFKYYVIPITKLALFIMLLAH
ncbi:hypothetical protein XNC3_1720016 [Xenorhabdus nematophila F1]|nr:hypothetical protein XNC3_1720016 [Xenorhabdus nematophila F1]